MKYVFALADARAGRRLLSGGKGHGLHWLLRLGYKIPNGFVISSRAFRDFILHNDLEKTIEGELASIRLKSFETVSAASRNLQEAVLAGEIPEPLMNELSDCLRSFRNKRFAVRSSAAFEDSSDRSWAGQFDSYLEVRRNQISDSIKKCWASLFNKRAMSYSLSAYRVARTLHYAVVIQEMVPSEKAGVAFSVDPTSKGPGRMLIEATLGHGDSLVSGRSVSTSFVLEKDTCRLVRGVHSDTSHMRAFRTQELGHVCRVVTRIERALGRPVDVEWALSRGKLFILQVRPITTFESRLIQRPSELPTIDDYELTFKVSGLSFLFTTMLSVGFGYLSPLFTSDTEGKFSQYFTKEKMEYAARFGMRWFSKPNSVASYESRFTNYYRRSLRILDKMLSRGTLSKAAAARFFSIVSRCFTLYSKTDNEFTDVAFMNKDRHPAIARNLRRVSRFKDKARLWINGLAIDEDSYFSRLRAALSAQFLISPQDLDCYAVDEVLSLFEGRTVSQRALKARRQSYCIFYSSGNLAHLSGAASIRYIASIDSKLRKPLSTEVAGRVANAAKGRITGRAMVISVDYGQIESMNRAIQEMRNGDILIADFTAPELMEACRKAKAIVTDIGGLLSHAAIVSRELGLPCIVGTINATKVFKTGDQVVVDCERGLVGPAKPTMTQQ